jgi:nicotinamide-nucleotide amidase
VTLAEQIVRDYAAKGWMIATAESCTGGLVAAAITDVSGSSEIFDRGFVTYSNAAKTEMLDVDVIVLENNGAVSATTAKHMALGALSHSLANVAVAVTGVAGPGGSTAEKPVGLVHFACAVRGGRIVHVERRFGDLNRDAIRRGSVHQALQLLAEALR